MKYTKEDFDREEDEGHNRICRYILSQRANSHSTNKIACHHEGVCGTCGKWVVDCKCMRIC